MSNSLSEESFRNEIVAIQWQGDSQEDMEKFIAALDSVITNFSEAEAMRYVDSLLVPHFKKQLKLSEKLSAEVRQLDLLPDGDPRCKGVTGWEYMIGLLDRQISIYKRDRNEAVQQSVGANRMKQIDADLGIKRPALGAYEKGKGDWICPPVQRERLRFQIQLLQVQRCKAEWW